MELLFVTLGGAIIGLAARYTLKGRHSYGVLLLPAIGAAVSAIVWSALTWAGWKFDATWIWVVSLVLAAVVAPIIASAITRHRARADASMMAALSRA
jgi:uncharacterized membrane protein YeaQ/YmgE (transglycosylase-associated protein family)